MEIILRSMEKVTVRLQCLRQCLFVTVTQS